MVGSKPRKLRVLNRRKRASLEFLNCSVDRGLIREKPEGSLAKRPVKRYAGSNLARPLPIGRPGPTPRAGAVALARRRLCPRRRGAGLAGDGRTRPSGGLDDRGLAWE